jgi:hypothetical protein
MMTKRNEKPAMLPEVIEFEAIRSRRIELCQRADELAAELKKVNADVAKVGAANEQRFNRKSPQPQAPKPLSAKAKDLIGNVVSIAAPAMSPTPKPDAADKLIAKARELSAELAATKEAIEALRGPEFDHMLLASQAFCERHAGEYQAIVERLVTAATVLADAVITHDTFTKDTAAAGLTWSFARPVPLTLLGDDVLFRLGELVKAANRNGHTSIDAATLRRWTQHRRHFVEAPTRHNRPQVSRVRAGVVSAFSKDAKPLQLAASRVRNQRK